MEIMHRLFIERGGREISREILRTQVRNIENKNLLSDLQIAEIVDAGMAEDDVEALNKENDEVDGDLD